MRHAEGSRPGWRAKQKHHLAWCFCIAFDLDRTRRGSGKQRFPRCWVTEQSEDERADGHIVRSRASIRIAKSPSQRKDHIQCGLFFVNRIIHYANGSCAKLFRQTTVVWRCTLKLKGSDYATLLLSAIPRLLCRYYFLVCRNLVLFGRAWLA